MNDNGHIVCGWHTSDYSSWADKLRRNLDRMGEPHDIIEVGDMDGGWERNTLRKARQIKGAMSRHPTKTIIFLDVDCEVFEPLSELATSRGDVALHMRIQRRARGNGRLFARSGTLVLQPTYRTRAFVTIWATLSERAPRGHVDQYTLTEAIVRTPEMLIENLDVRYCATARDQVANPAIFHDSASKDAKKIPSWMRAFHYLTSARVTNGAYQ